MKRYKQPTKTFIDTCNAIIALTGCSKAMLTRMLRIPCEDLTGEYPEYIALHPRIVEAELEIDPEGILDQKSIRAHNARKLVELRPFLWSLLYDPYIAEFSSAPQSVPNPWKEILAHWCFFSPLSIKFIANELRFKPETLGRLVWERLETDEFTEASPDEQYTLPSVDFQDIYYSLAPYANEAMSIRLKHYADKAAAQVKERNRKFQRLLNHV